VGHNALGSGQIIDQGAKLVDKAVKSGAVFEGDGWHYLQTSLDDGKALHFIGLLSDGGVHSRYDQLLACLKGAVECNCVSRDDLKHPCCKINNMHVKLSAVSTCPGFPLVPLAIAEHILKADGFLATR
jgi:hypothetical protein